VEAETLPPDGQYAFVFPRCLPIPPLTPPSPLSTRERGQEALGSFRMCRAGIARRREREMKQPPQMRVAADLRSLRRAVPALHECVGSFRIKQRSLRRGFVWHARGKTDLARRRWHAECRHQPEVLRLRLRMTSLPWVRSVQNAERLHSRGFVPYKTDKRLAVGSFGAGSVEMTSPWVRSAQNRKELHRLGFVPPKTCESLAIQPTRFSRVGTCLILKLSARWVRLVFQRAPSSF
jgi:hypothetical protein